MMTGGAYQLQFGREAIAIMESSVSSKEVIHPLFSHGN